MNGKFTKGHKTWNKGKKLSESHKRKLREAKLKNPVRFWKGKTRKEMTGEANPNYGKFGKNHPKWVEYKKHSFHKSIRETYKYRQWRSDVFTRDEFKCLLCGSKKIIQADHFPKSFIKIIDEYTIKTLEDSLSCEELWNINNGRTLCYDCHRKTDTWGRRKSNSIL